MKVLKFEKPQEKVSTFYPETTEIITLNFRKKELRKSVDIDNSTGLVKASFEVFDKPTPFMGEGFGEIVNILLKKNSKSA